MNYPLVKIDWKDSRQPSSEWKWLEDFEPTGAVTCTSVGWLIHDDKDVKVLAQNLGDTSEENKQASGIIQIPACSVFKITPLT